MGNQHTICTSIPNKTIATPTLDVVIHVCECDYKHYSDGNAYGPDCLECIGTCTNI